jgi:hypothetical protein
MTMTGTFNGTLDSQDNNYPNNTLCPAAQFASSGVMSSLLDGTANGGTCQFGGLHMAGLGSKVWINPVSYANLPSCSSAYEVTQIPITDSTVFNPGTPITTGGGTYHVNAACIGGNWVVAFGPVPTGWSTIAGATSNAIFPNASYSTTFQQSYPAPWTWTNTTAAVASGTAPPQAGTFNAISYGTTGCTTGTSCVLPLTINSGNSVLVFTVNQSTTGTLSDNGSNTYTLLTSSTNSGWLSTVWYCLSCNAATTITYNGTSAINGVSAGTFTGVSAIGNNHLTFSTSGTPISDTIITAGTNSLVVTSAMMDQVSSFTPTNGTLQAFASQSTSNEMGLALLTTPTYTSGATVTTSGSWTGSLAYSITRSVELEGTSSSVVNQSSPIRNLCGQYWNGNSSAPDCWTEQVLLGTGSNPSSILTIAHLLASTGAAAVQVPALRTSPNLFATLPSCSSSTEGWQRAVSDSTTNTWGATITGGGADHVLAYCDGSAWTVAAK